MSLSVILVVVTIALVVWNVLRMRAREQAAADTLSENVAAGLTEPPSLHPVIDPALCIGCGGCVEACPEKNVLGMIDGVAVLIEPTSCIGHGACKEACPSDSIRLVFGTATRGVDLPVVGADFQTRVPGLYIAGELGGMGLIRNAIEQGRQAVDSIRRAPGFGTGDGLDLVIIGAGPAGLAASLASREHGLRFVTLEQDSLGGTIAHYPRGKIVMTRPAILPVVGRIPFRETTKERLLGFWTKAVDRADLPIRFGKQVTAVRDEGQGLVVETETGEYRARNVLLAIGRRGSPRALGVPGEDLPKVVYRVTDPAQFRGRRVLVVGGGDSALEAALTLADEPRTQVTLSYRSEAFGRARPRNRARLEQATVDGRVHVLLRSRVLEIRPDDVRIDVDGVETTIRNDDVVICAGGVLPTAFLRGIGIDVQTHHGLN